MIIAFGHRKQQGKDTAVNAILKHVTSTAVFDMKPKRKVMARSFAEPLYSVCFDLIPEFSTKKFYDNFPFEKERKIERLGMTPRQILIGVGQTLKTVIGPDCFAQGLIVNRNPEEITLITDLRFPCEVEAIRESNGICVKVERPGLNIRGDEVDDVLNDWDGWDHVLANDCDKATFELKAVKLFEEIMKT